MHNKPNTIWRHIWNFAASVKLAIIVLILIAATSIIGTVIPQNAGNAFYMHKYNGFTYKLFSIFDFFDMYNAWWFLLLLLLLVINIIACSLSRLNKTWKIIFPKKISFNIARYKKIKSNKTFVKQGEFKSIASEYKAYLSRRFRHILTKEDETTISIYGEKGRWTRFGVYIVHISILFLLIGALIGAAFGFKGHLNLNEGESADSIIISKQKIEKKLGFSIKCNTFNIKFYDTGAPEEFKSNISIIENNKEILKADIIVNDPLRYKGINFFQSSYGVASSDRIDLEILSKESKMTYHQTLNTGDSFNIPENGGKFTLIKYLPQFDFKGHSLGESFLGTVKKVDGKEFMVILPTRFPTFDRMRNGDFAFIVGDFEKKYYTGLQVTHDPGVVYVYIGFIFMIAGCFITFFMSHQSIMVEITKDHENKLNILVAGTANRNNQSMKIKIEKIAKQLEQ
jgi:cytochrome c biogenesis protein